MLAQAQLNRFGFLEPSRAILRPPPIRRAYALMSSRLANRLGRPLSIADFLRLQGKPPATYAGRIIATSPYAYWPLNEASGTTAVCPVNAAMNGTYNRDLSVMGTEAGIGDGSTAPIFDGTNDAVDVISAALTAAFNGAEGTVAFWAKPYNAGVWTDSTYRRMVNFITDANSIIYVIRHSTNGRMDYFYRAAGTDEAASLTSQSFTTWTHLAMTWSVTADTVAYYMNGAPAGNSDTTLGTWAGAVYTAVLGAQNTSGGQPWHGSLAHAALWATALPAATIADLATV